MWRVGRSLGCLLAAGDEAESRQTAEQRAAPHLVFAPSDDALVIGGAQRHVDILGAVAKSQGIGLGEELEVATRLVRDRLVGHIGAANLRVAAASESRAHV